ncbi:MAG: lipopolysaccharide heptosyltransferase II [Syntrophorhabdaceae bacterium]|nr:lipopolysaccharide heptosyltransferase II [Syntrophorhabdaceae bacterium]
MTGKTIVYLPNWLGDMVMAVPFLHALRQHSQDEIWAMGKESAIHLYNGLGLFDRFVTIQGKGLTLFFETTNKLNRVNFARAIALPHSFRSALFFFNLRVRDVIGYPRNKRGFMLNIKVKEEERLESTVEHYLRIADTLGVPRSIEAPILAVSADEETKFDKEFSDTTRPYGVMIVGAQYGPSKCWPAAYFSELADEIIEKYGMNVYMLPGRNEDDLARKVHEGIHAKDRAAIKSMNIRDMKVCLSRAAFVVSNDTGPRHISAALSVPTVVLAGPMDERYTGYPSTYTRVVSKSMDCRPCNKKKCDGDHGCMTGIKPQEIAEIVGEILEKSV